MRLKAKTTCLCSCRPFCLFHATCLSILLWCFRLLITFLTDNNMFSNVFLNSAMQRWHTKSCSSQIVGWAISFLHFATQLYGAEKIGSIRKSLKLIQRTPSLSQTCPCASRVSVCIAYECQRMAFGCPRKAVIEGQRYYCCMQHPWERKAANEEVQVNQRHMSCHQPPVRQVCYAMSWLLPTV